MKRVALTVLALSFFCNASANAAIEIWNENTDGDLGDYLTPTPVTLQSGSNSIVGSIGLPDYHDAVTFTIPDGYGLDSFTLDSFAGLGNDQFEYAFYVGSNGAGTPTVTGSASSSDVGSNLLSSLLGAGTYTLLLQQFLPSGQAYQVSLRQHEFESAGVEPARAYGFACLVINPSVCHRLQLATTPVEEVIDYKSI